MPSRTSKNLRQRFPFLIFAFFYLLFVLLTYPQYGITWDEPDCYFWGDAYGQYVQGHPEAYQAAAQQSGRIHIYCHVYAAFLSFFNPSLNAETFHGYNLCFAFLMFWAAFELLLHAFRKPWMALFGPLFLFLIPRLSGDLATNPRDMSFAVVYFLSLAALYAIVIRSDDKFTPRNILALGILFGLAHSFRTVGYSLYVILPLSLGWMFFDRQNLRSLKAWRFFARNSLLPLIPIFLLSNFLMVLLYPSLHSETFPRLWEMLIHSARLFANQTNLFLGREIPAELSPVTYLPVWILVTTPLALLALASASPFLFRSTKKDPLAIVFGSAFWVNVILYFVLRPRLMDGLRLYLFLLPVIGIGAAIGMIRLMAQNPRNLWRSVALGLVIANLAIVSFHMGRLFPYQNLYFNELTGGLKGAYGRFDTDYWGETYKEAVEWLKQNELKDLDPSVQTVALHTRGNAFSSVYYFKPGMLWKPFEEAEYYLSFTRWHENERAGNIKPLHVVMREGVPLNYIYRLKGASKN